MSTFEILWEYRQAFASGLSTSVEIAIWVWGIGLLFGSLLGVGAHHYNRNLGKLLRVLGAVITAIPILVILFWLHYPLQAALHVVINPFYTAVVALALVNVFGVNSLSTTGYPRSRSGSPDTTDSDQMYWPSPSLILDANLTKSAWTSHRSEAFWRY